MIPVKCFTCGNVLADKYRYYTNIVESSTSTNKNEYAEKNNFHKTIEADTLDELFIFNICCRRHLLTHVEIH
jgi:DNA-directed RNA polymerase I, II, and III subunit RPABC5